MADKKNQGNEHGDQAAAVDRREFLAGAASLAVLAGCSDDGGPSVTPDGPGVDAAVSDAASDLAAGDARACSAQVTPLAPVTGPARVVEIHDPQSIVGFTDYDGARVKAMLIEGLKTLTGAPDVQQAWQALIPDFSPSMRIGIKLNCLNRHLHNSAEVVLALVESLTSDLGAESSKIWVWERRTDELTRSNLSQSVLGVQVAGTVVSHSDASGPGYVDQPECVIDRETRLSRIVTDETDFNINVALLKAHNISGITGAMKNTYGCIDNPWEFHDGFNTYMPALYRLDGLHKAFGLHITESLRAVTNGAPTDHPDTAPGRLLLATDPVALDSHAIELVNQLRASEHQAGPLDPEKLKWLDEAIRLNLGSPPTDTKLVTMP